MKIGTAKAILLAPVYSPYPAGGAQSFPIVAAALSKLFKSVLVITEYHPGKPYVCNESGVSVLRIFPVRDNKGSKSYLYSLVSYWLTQILLISFLLALRLLGFQTLHYTRYSSYCLSLLLVIWRASGGLVVYDCRTMAFGERSLRALKRSLGTANAALANSESALNSVLQLSKVPIASYIINPLLLPSKDGIPPLSLFPSLVRLANEPYILCMGTLSPRKNSLLVLQAFEFLLARKALVTISPNPLPSIKYSQLKLVYAGRSDLSKSSLERLISSDSVVYLGPVSHLESLALTSAASLSINISSAEGIPRSMLEALYLQVPCILPSCVPEFLRYLPEVCIDIPHSDLASISALASLISIVLQDPDRVRNLLSKYPIDAHLVDNYHNLIFEKIYRHFYAI